MANNITKEGLLKELAEIRAREKEIKAMLKELDEAGQEAQPELVDPVSMWRQQGPEALRACLSSMDLIQLKQVARANAMAQGVSSRNPERWVEAIMSRAEARATMGHAFRTYNK